MSKSSPDSQARLVAPTLRNALRNAIRHRDELRLHVIRDAWSITKRFGSPAIENLEVRELPFVQDAVIEGYVDDPNRAVLAALCGAVGAKTFFEIGTNRGRTTWTVARNNPELELFSLDLPSQESLGEISLDLNDSDRDFFVDDWDRGEAYKGTPEEERITTLEGDSATFDYTPYLGKMDVVFIDGAHSYAYVKSDTENALRLLAPGGTIVWDDYPSIPGVYTYLNEAAPSLPHPLRHVFGTRLVICTGKDIFRRVEDRARQFAA